MSLIKFPHVKPNRMTPKLLRTDELNRSPATNIQQVNARGNPAWVWTFEYNDISESERDIVEAFLLGCKGSVNTFKITDPAEYALNGAMSNWLDIFSGRGAFVADTGSSTSAINSWFGKSAPLDTLITDYRSVRIARTVFSPMQTQWKGHGSVGGVSSFQAGAAYVQRTKYFPGNNTDGNQVYLPVGSGSVADVVATGVAGSPVKSADCLTGPFVIGALVTSLSASIYDSTSGGGIIGNYWEHSDYKIIRCAMVSNSENLLTRSNDFDHADWTQSAVSVSSGNATDPEGGSNAFYLFVNSDESSGAHYLQQTFTKINTEDIYTLSIRARASGSFLDYCQLEFNDGTGDYARLLFNVASGEISNRINLGSFIRLHSKVFPIGSDWYRLQATAYVSSLATLNCLIYAANSDGSTSFATADTGYIEIHGAQLRQFPFMGQYTPTVTSTVVGSSYQTGGKLTLDGFDANDVIASGQRFEVVNRFHNVDNDVFERSEFKRTTKLAKAQADGWIELDIDPSIRNAPVPDRSMSTTTNPGETMHNPVIFHKPEMKARLLAGTIQYIEKPLKMMDVVFDVIEDMTE